jgi:hypothetical protein
LRARADRVTTIEIKVLDTGTDGLPHGRPRSQFIKVRLVRLRHSDGTPKDYGGSALWRLEDIEHENLKAPSEAKPDMSEGDDDVPF